MNSFFTPTARKAIYSLGAAAMAVAVAYGFVAADKAPLWLGLLGTIISVLAASNVDKIAAEEIKDEMVAGPASDLPVGTPVTVVPDDPETEVDPWATIHHDIPIEEETFDDNGSTRYGE